MLWTGLITTAPATAAPAPIQPQPATSVTADALPTVQINGVVWSTDMAGSKVYSGGSFTRARPAGASLGVNETVRNNLLAFDVTTGNLDTSFAPDLNGQVLDVAVSPDKTRVYVVGDFTTANGQARRRVAAYSTATGQLITSFNPVGVNSRARAVAATNDTVFVGGGFAGAGNTGRTNLAAFRASDGALLPWNPTAERAVWALAVSPDGANVFAAGQFTTINSQPAYGLAKINATTGALDPSWAPIVRNGGDDAAVGSLRAQGDQLYGTTWHFGPGGNLEGTFKVPMSTGKVAWVTDCHGDAYDAVQLQGTVYVATHAHYCGNMGGGHPQYSSWRFQHAQAWSDTVTDEILNEVHGYPNWHGQAQGPAMVNWLPTLAMGSYTGQYQAGWSLTGNDNFLVFAGEFPRVNGTAQQGLVRFGKRPVAPGTQGPQFDGGVFRPEAIARGTGSARVTWQAGYDRDDLNLTYRLYRGGTLVNTQNAASNWWTLPALGYVDTGLTPGSTYQYRVTASDPGGNTVSSATISYTHSNAASPNAYAQSVAAAGASLYWPLNDARTATPMTIRDRAGFNDAVADTDVTAGQPGAIAGDAAMSFGTAQPAEAWGRAYAKGTQYAPDTFSVQAWIRTDTTQGGRIVGFGDLQQGDSGHHDRHVYLTSDGRVVFGVRATDGSNRTVASGASFNDNQWHMITATMSPKGMELYVDGVRVGRRTDTTQGETYLGYWRLQGDTLGGWASRPARDNYVGGIDEVAVYPTALTQDTIVAQYAASGRTAVIPSAPADAYGAAVYADDPDLFWRLEESAGTTANDSGRSLNPGTYRSGVSQGATGVLTGTKAAQFDGSDDVVFSNAQFSNPTQYSTEAWFKTTTTSGGKIIGFGNAQQGQSSNYDRHVYMLDNGHLVFGVWTGTMNTIETATAFNDGGWHHVVATQSGAGMRLYVDGDLQGTNQQAESQPYDGYWRVGGDTRWGGSSDYFNGVIDEVAVYSGALSASRVAAHYAAAGGVVNQAPSAEFVTNIQERRVTFAGTGTDPDGTIASYAWDFGDGQSSAEQNPTHVFTADGKFSVKLTVTDNRGATGSVTHDVTVAAAGLPTDAYGAAVIADGPRLYWRLGESSGTVANDASGGHSTGEIVGAPTLGRPGAIQNPNTAILFDGDGKYVTSSDSFVNPQVYSNEAWFRTTSTTGGKVMGFGCSYQSPSNCYDRHIYLQPDGKVVFGTYTGATNTITTDATYNDGQWHHVVATQSSAGLRLYLDGQLAGTNPATAAEGYTGYLHVGGDNTWGSDPWFDGEIDEVAFYLTALSEQRVAAHYTAGMPQPNQPPVPSFTLTQNLLSVSVDASGSSDPDGSIASYAWDFGDGATGSGATATHAYAAAGTYTVALTVTDDKGVSRQKSQSVTVQAANVGPTAAFTSTLNDRALSVDAAASHDPDGTIASYAWDFGDGATGSGAQASHTYTSSGTFEVTLTVTDDRGATDVAKESIVVAAPTVIASDAFQRTVANGWGNADVGGTWTRSGAAANFAVAPGKASIAMAAGSGPSAYLNGVSARDVDLTATLSYDKPGTGGGAYASFIVRANGTSDYRTTIRMTATAVTADLRRKVAGAETVLGTATIPGGALAANQSLNIRLQAVGANATTLRVKVWRTGTAEPTAWTLSFSDSSAGLQQAGSVGIYSYLSGSATNGPIKAQFGALSVTPA
ncbi:hypothetical protein BW730_00745 [Tessaracoccus aquimaris]|uniref:Cell surface protein n=2 Tax=Tessaracoccus aquimaris TaxID=1332264 RepID=A0A1Q2CJU7_9ACTN|nr:hypothetical protein BW730_00745 [Tessaracoccus aquimaris]